MWNTDVLEQHASEAAFLYWLRDRRIDAPHWDLPRIAALDERLDAHVDGVRVGEGAGWIVAARALDTGESGAVYTAMLLALDTGEKKKLSRVLDCVGEARSLARAVVAALATAPRDRAAPVLEQLAAWDSAPLHREIALAGYAAQRLDPGQILTDAAIDDRSAAVRARAARAAGALGRVDLTATLAANAKDGDPDVRCWSAWAAALWGQAAAREALWRVAESDAGPRALVAAALAAQRSPTAEAVPRIEILAARPESLRMAAIAASACGDPALVRVLIGLMREPVAARAAGAAFSAISGIPMAHIRRPSPPRGASPNDDPKDPNVQTDPDAELEWPDAERAARAWASAEGRFRRGIRHWDGAPISPSSVRARLRGAGQPLRALAAIELAAMTPGSPLFPVRAPAPRQLSALAQLPV